MSMKGKIVIITGSNSGIGKETALALSKKMGTVVITVRSKENGEAARQEIIKEVPDASLDIMFCDLASRSSIAGFVKEFTGKFSRLDVLINNAGAEFSKRGITLDGFENSIGVNYLGSFLLSEMLIPTLHHSAPSRIINLSSGLHKSGHIDFSDLQSLRKYDSMKAYSTAKLMVLMWTYDLAKRINGTGVTVNAVMPGFVATNLGKNSGSTMQSIMFSLVRPMQTTAKKGAETSIYLASSMDIEGITGKCFASSKRFETSVESYDLDKQVKLREATVKMLI
jgi:NAD(P)-dependent dehydrogenase (short-subunit alcohol dehydrogenase family)